MIGTQRSWDELLHEISASRLRRGSRLTRRDLRHRRAQLSAIGLVMLLTLGAVTAWLLAAPAAGPSWWPSPRILHLAAVALAVGFAGYVLEKELHLRRLARLLDEQRDLTWTLAHRVGDLEALAHMEELASKAAGPGEVLTVVLTQAIKQSRARSGAVLVSESPHTLRVICASGSGYEVESRHPLDESPLWTAAHGVMAALDSNSGGNASIAAPLVCEDVVVGVLALKRKREGSFDEYDQLVLALFAERAAPWVAAAISAVRREPAPPANEQVAGAVRLSRST